LAHIPVHRFGQGTTVVLFYCASGAMCMLCGRATAGPFRLRTDAVLTYSLALLTLAHCSTSLLRPIVQLHPSVDPHDFVAVSTTCAFVAFTFMVAGRYTAKRL